MFLLAYLLSAGASQPSESPVPHIAAQCGVKPYQLDWSVDANGQ
jgi:hypothetical protein